MIPNIHMPNYSHSEMHAHLLQKWAASAYSKMGKNKCNEVFGESKLCLCVSKYS